MTPFETADKAFYYVYKGQSNFITPKIKERGTTPSGEYFYELSEGKFLDADLFGVTILTIYGEKKPDISKCLHTLEDAQDLIKSL